MDIGSFAESLILGGGVSSDKTSPEVQASNPYIRGNEKDITAVTMTDEMRQSLIESSITGQAIEDPNIFGNQEVVVDEHAF